MYVILQQQSLIPLFGLTALLHVITLKIYEKKNRSGGKQQQQKSECTQKKKPFPVVPFRSRLQKQGYLYDQTYHCMVSFRTIICFSFTNGFIFFSRLFFNPGLPVGFALIIMQAISFAFIMAPLSYVLGNECFFGWDLPQGTKNVCQFWERIDMRVL